MFAVNIAMGEKTAFPPKMFSDLPRGSLGKYGLFQETELVCDVNNKPLEKNTFKKIKNKTAYIRIFKTC